LELCGLPSLRLTSHTHAHTIHLQCRLSDINHNKCIQYPYIGYQTEPNVPMITLYHILNVFFFVFHIALIPFNLFGWIFRPLRKWNLITLGLTACSWFLLGIFFGFGYCFLTDWHWQIREKLGYSNPYNSYIHFLVETLFDVQVSATLVDWFTGIFFGAAVIMSIVTNFSLFKAKRKT
jgi:hypothetical protein